MCETRWVDRHESVLYFKSCLKTIIECLSLISEWHDSESSSKAACLKNSLLTLSFLVSLYCLSEVLSTTVNLSKVLQTKAISRQYASTLVQNVITTLKQMRESAEESFENLFTDVENIATELEVPVVMPRISKFQRNRPNPDVNTCEDYFRITVYIPLLDNIIDDLENRFNDSTMLIFDFNVLVPDVLVTKNTNEISEITKNIARYLAKVEKLPEDYVVTSLRGEINLYKSMHENDNHPESIPDTIEVAFKKCDKNMLPFIKKLLQIALTWPTSVATAERSFSALRRLKTWLSSTMKQDRLVGLALLHVHGRDTDVKTDAIIDRYANKRNRQLEFLI